jgi:hypothetical protein
VTNIVNSEHIKNKIYLIRGLQVILDSDLATLYEVKTKALNQAVKRNNKRFPKDFMFQLTITEKNELVTNCDRLQHIKHATTTPYVFTEQGVSMLSGVLKSEKAISINIQIIRTFVSLRSFISQHATLFARIDTIEQKQLIYDKKFEKVFSALKSHTPQKGIFYDGQIFEAYTFVCDLIKQATKEIILIDNYVDETTLTLFSKKKENVSVKIYTKRPSKQTILDVNKFNAQYKGVTIIEFNEAHDRFIIIDQKDTYHFGASLKDLGKKWFAFSKFEKEGIKMISKINNVST